MVFDADGEVAEPAYLVLAHAEAESALWAVGTPRSSRPGEASPGLRYSRSRVSGASTAVSAAAAIQHRGGLADGGVSAASPSAALRRG